MMKTFLLFVLVAVSGFGCASTSDSVAIAKKETREQNPQAKAEVTRFLTEMTDARLMDLQESKLAAQHGKHKAVHDYANTMLTDQTMLLEEIRTVAASEGVTLPTTISDKKATALQELQKKRGKYFDRMYLSMISIDHQRDVKAFDLAASTPETYGMPVSDFASKNRALIQTHLDTAEEVSRKAK